jgi:hypothetical protein
VGEAPNDAGGVVAVEWAAGCVEEERAGAATGLGGGDGAGGGCGEGDGGFSSGFASDVEGDVSSGGTEVLDAGGAGFR